MRRIEVAEWVAAHEPADPTEAEHKGAVWRLLQGRDDPFDRRSLTPGHVTASAFVLSPDGVDLLLIHHGTLGLWLQPGGHVDARDEDLVAAVRREVAEETGLTGCVVLPGAPYLLDIDVHEIPSNPRRGEGAHLHFDLRLLLMARTREVAAGSDARAVRWVPLDELDTVDSDASVRRAVQRIRTRQARWASQEVATSPAAERNRGPIGSSLQRWVGPGAEVLEIASGTGQHAEWLSEVLEVSRWQPSDVSEEALASVDRRRGRGRHVDPPLRLDLSAGRWEALRGQSFDVVYVSNLLHICPWEAGRRVFELAASVLRPGGRLVVYGPFHAAGRPTGEGNVAFDATLRARDPSWGVRPLEGVVAAAARAGLGWERTEVMPADNRLVLFRQPGGPFDDRMEDVLSTWFGPGETPDRAWQARWWRADPEVDAALGVAFGTLHAAALAGDLEHWAADPRGVVALVLLLDQFSRQLHRGTAAAFAADAEARRLTAEALRRRLDEGLPPFHRAFLLMPWMHSEDLADQERAVIAFAELAARVEEPLREPFDGFVRFAIQHRDIVARFGRFPHRNEMLDRRSTPEEEEFLLQPGSSF